MTEPIHIFTTKNTKEIYILGIRDGFLETIENTDGITTFRRIEVSWEQ